VTPGQLGDVRAAAQLLGQLPPSRRCAADTAYDSNALRQFLRERGTLPVIPNNPTRKRFHTFDRNAYKRRNLIERAFCRLKDWRRVATRYDKLARNFHAAAVIAAAAVEARHLGGGPCLVDKDEALWIEVSLSGAPCRPIAHHVGTLLLAGVRGFF